MRELGKTARRLGFRTVPSFILPHVEKQAVFFGSHFDLFLTNRWLDSSLRLGTAYFHGRLGQGVAEFDECFRKLSRYHERISRIQVSCLAMEEFVLTSGIDPAKVHRIPIGINLAFFQRQTGELRRSTREQHGLPQSAAIVGSFQKDGVGWGKGMEPKLVKGPDVFLQAVGLLKQCVSELFVLLVGPSRGYVKAGLERLGIPYKHLFLKDYREVCRLYGALDAYVIASREEGGPKAVLEAMASGVPVISTRVGQAVDLVDHGRNGWLVDVEDATAIAAYTEQALLNRSSTTLIIENGLRTAEINRYDAQIDSWQRLLDGFVEK